MTTAEYLKQRGNELLDLIGINPTSSLVIKTLSGEVLTIEHRLPKAKEKEFVANFFRDNSTIPAVLIERVQFPNKLNGAEALDLEKKIKSNQIDLYSRNNEYVFDTYSNISYSHNDWMKQLWSPSTVYDKGESEYLLAFREKKTPDKAIIGYSTHSTKEEIKSYLQDNKLNSNDIEINLYKIFDTNNSIYKKAKESNIQRYLDDPRNKVEFLEKINIPETVLVYSNNNDYNYKLYSGNSMLRDYYIQNQDKAGTLFVCKTDNLDLFTDHLSINQPLDNVLNVEIVKELSVPEVNFYIQSRIQDKLEIDNNILMNDTVKKHTQEFYADFREFLKKKGIEDVKRDKKFIIEAIIHQPKTIDILSEKEKTDIDTWQKLLAYDTSLINYMPKELITLELINKVNYHEPADIYKLLPSNLNSEQIVMLIDKDLKMVNGIDDNGKKLMAIIGALPEDLRNKDIITGLHNKYDKTDFLKELAYSLVVLDLEINNKNAIYAMVHFCNNRFMKEYDPMGADDSWGQICGCEYYINKTMINPADKFEPELLTIKQWHDIASQDTRMLEFIPEKIIKDEAFWVNYQDFIDKGRYLDHPDNEYRIDKFDEYEVFSKMPDHLKTNPDICRDLLEKKAISISFIDNPTEEHYHLVNPKDYYRIPIDLREKESFKDLALSAFSINKWNILDIPKKFITKEMVSEALSYDMELCNRVPIHFLSEELLCDKIKKHEYQGVISVINRSGEHPQFIEQELSNRKTVLQYVPEELKTVRVCQEALKVNPDNAAFLPKNYFSKLQNDKQLLQLIDINPVTTKSEAPNINSEVTNYVFSEKHKADQDIPKNRRNNPENTDFLHPTQKKEHSNSRMNSNKESNQRRKGRKL